MQEPSYVSDHDNYCFKLYIDGNYIGNVCTNMNNMLDQKVGTNDPRLTDARTPLEHNHDDRYYTEIETNTLVNKRIEGSSNDPVFANRPSVSIDGSICGIPVTYEQENAKCNSPVVGFHYSNNDKQLIINWYANGTMYTSKINIDEHMVS